MAVETAIPPITDGHLFALLIWGTVFLLGIVISLIAFIIKIYINEIKTIQDWKHKTTIDIKELMDYKDAQVGERTHRSDRKMDRPWK